MFCPNFFVRGVLNIEACDITGLWLSDALTEFTSGFLSSSDESVLIEDASTTGFPVSRVSATESTVSLLLAAVLPTKLFKESKNSQ